jgi:hypothetical protein
MDGVVSTGGGASHDPTAVWNHRQHWQHLGGRRDPLCRCVCDRGPINTHPYGAREIEIGASVHAHSDAEGG